MNTDWIIFRFVGAADSYGRCLPSGRPVSPGQIGVAGRHESGEKFISDATISAPSLRQRLNDVRGTDVKFMEPDDLRGQR